VKLINSVGPNPHVVRMFAAERGIKLEMENLDIMAGQNRQSDSDAHQKGNTLAARLRSRGRKREQAPARVHSE